MNSSTISAIIIDDEPEAINLLEMFLRQFPFIKVTEKQTHAIKGLELVKDTMPELVFLDIDMPSMNGLQVADRIHSENFYSEIVFTTAHQEYAFDALGVEPLDFLTKPFSIDDLEIVIHKYLAKAEKKKQERKLDKFIHSQANTPIIKLPTLRGVLIAEIRDIAILKSDLNNCIVFLNDGSNETITRNLYIVLRMINSPAFFQINRSTAINVNYLQRVDKKTEKCTLAFNHTTYEEKISKNYLVYFEKLNLFPVI